MRLCVTAQQSAAPVRSQKVHGASRLLSLDETSRPPDLSRDWAWGTGLDALLSTMFSDSVGKIRLWIVFKKSLFGGPRLLVRSELIIDSILNGSSESGIKPDDGVWLALEMRGPLGLENYTVRFGQATDLDLIHICKKHENYVVFAAASTGNLAPRLGTASWIEKDSCGAVRIGRPSQGAQPRMAKSMGQTSRAWFLRGNKKKKKKLYTTMQCNRARDQVMLWIIKFWDVLTKLGDLG